MTNQRRGDEQAVHKGIMLSSSRYNITSHDHFLSILSQLHAKKNNLIAFWDSICQLRLLGFNLLDYPFLFCLQHLGHTREGLNAFSELMKRMKEEGMPANKAIIGHFIVICRELEDVEGIKYWMNEKKEGGFELHIMDHIDLIRTLWKRGEEREAEEWFDQVKKEGKVDSAFFNSFIAHYLHNGKVEKAKEWLERMKEAKVRVNEVTYTHFVTYYINQNEVEEAEKWWKEGRENKKDNVLILAILVKGLVKNGKIERAEQILEEVQEERKKEKGFAELYSFLKDGYLKTGNTQKAEEIDKKMKSN